MIQERAASCTCSVLQRGPVCVCDPAAQCRAVPYYPLQDGGGSRHRGVDPVVPYVDEQQLAAMRAFYGLAPDCPVPHALVRPGAGVQRLQC